MAVRYPVAVTGILSALVVGGAVALAPLASAETSADRPVTDTQRTPATTTASVTPTATEPTPPPPPPVLAAEPIDDTSPLEGANDYACKPSAQKPRPVILLHGTYENMQLNWGTAAPRLKAEGYCVFAFNYGAKNGDLAQGLAAVPASALELSAYVDKVLLATGTSKVDIVGHSQGGMMPREYLKNLGGAAKVNHLIGLAPDNHGTTLSGLSALATENDLIGTAVFFICPGCTDQIVNSAFMQQLNAGGDTVPGVQYTVIATKNDQIVTPFTSGFLEGPNVTNITLQDVCPDDTTEHIGMSFNASVIQLVVNALDPTTAKEVECA